MTITSFLIFKTLVGVVISLLAGIALNIAKILNFIRIFSDNLSSINFNC